MARAASEVLNETQVTDGEQTDNDEDDEDNDTSKNASDRENLESLDPGTRVSVMVTMPKELKLKILDATEQKDGYTVARFLRELIADNFDFELPNVTRTRRSKYATEEERKAAQARKQKERNELIKKLLAAHKAGEIDIEALSDDDDDDE